jgi:hypothetical protein
MVFVYDQGSEFNGTLEQVWAFNKAHSEHPHASISNISREQINETTRIMSYDFRGREGVIKIKYKGTTHFPLGMTYEYLEGPFAGSKAFQYYIPKGDKTEVVMVGNLLSPNLLDDKLKALYDDYVQIVFDEDNVSMSK